MNLSAYVEIYNNEKDERRVCRVSDGYLESFGPELLCLAVASSSPAILEGELLSLVGENGAKLCYPAETGVLVDHAYFVHYNAPGKPSLRLAYVYKAPRIKTIEEMRDTAYFLYQPPYEFMISINKARMIANQSIARLTEMGVSNEPPWKMVTYEEVWIKPPPEKEW